MTSKCEGRRRGSRVSAVVAVAIAGIGVLAGCGASPRGASSEGPTGTLSFPGPRTTIDGRTYITYQPPSPPPAKMAADKHLCSAVTAKEVAAASGLTIDEAIPNLATLSKAECDYDDSDYSGDPDAEVNVTLDTFSSSDAARADAASGNYMAEPPIAGHKIFSDGGSADTGITLEAVCDDSVLGVIGPQATDVNPSDALNDAHMRRLIALFIAHVCS